MRNFMNGSDFVSNCVRIELASSMAPIVTLSCKDSFTISHSLESPHLSSAANNKVYGNCYNLVDHSHEYVVEVITRGSIDNAIGTVMSVSDLKWLLNRVVIRKLNGKNLNTDVDFFRRTPSTIENLAVFIWQSMKKEMDEPELLYEVKLIDNQQNCVIFNGCNSYRHSIGQLDLTSDTD